MEIEFIVSEGFEFDDVEPGWYRATLIELTWGPSVEDRRTIRWIFQLEDGRRVGALSSLKWTVTGPNKSKAVRFLEGILGRDILPDEEWRDVVREAVGQPCRIKVERKTSRSGRQLSTVTMTAPA